MTFSVRTLINAWPNLMEGLKVTFLASVLGIIACLIWGTLIGIVLYRKPKVFGGICKGYVTFFRETPLLVQLYFLYYGLTMMGVGIPAFVCGILGLMLNDGAFVAEIVRGGLQGVEKGQWEAAYSFGFSYSQTLIHFILPQAMRSILDSLMNMFANIIKDTSLLMWVTVTELTYQAQFINIHKFEPVTAFLTAAVLYLALYSIVEIIQKVIDKRRVKNNGTI